MYDGSGLIEVLRGHEYLSHPFAVTMYGGEVYWTDWRTNTLAKANKWTGHNVTVVQRTNTQPFDLQVYHPSRQPEGMFHGRHKCINSHGETSSQRGEAQFLRFILLAVLTGMTLIQKKNGESSQFIVDCVIHGSYSPKTADLLEL